MTTSQLESTGGARPTTRGVIYAAWFSRLRVGLVIGLAVVIALCSAFLPIQLPLIELTAVLGNMLIVNLAFIEYRRRQAPSEAVLFLVMAADVVALTVLLYMTGGPINPFSSLYVVYVAFSAVMLSPRASWALSAGAFLGFGVLFFWSRPLLLAGDHEHDHGHDWHLQGMWLSFGLAAVLIVYFVQRLTQAMKARDLEVARLQAQQGRADRLAALGTMAAGAAHELATPLSTIAVVAKELERALDREPGREDAVDDVRLVRSQVARCRDILDQMSADSGEAAGEPLVQVDARAFCDKVLSNLRGDPARVEVVATGGCTLGRLPLMAVARGVRGLVTNGLHASAPEQKVRLQVGVEGEQVVVEVEDRGVGMDEEVLARVGEPFHTTKPPGQGMGLGVFLMRSVAERLDGALTYVSRPGQGTTAKLTLPLVR